VTIMKTYYKATRLDGTDFYSGTVDYAGHLASGRPLKRKPDGRELRCCTDAVYHASDTPAETLLGGKWPCRLFEVTGRPVDQQKHKFGFRSLRVVREIPAWRALGPNGEAVAALIEQATRNTPDEAARLTAAWDAAWDRGRPSARLRYALCKAAGDDARYGGREAAHYAVAHYDVVHPAACEAAGALVVRDLISEERFSTLCGPWASVMGGDRSVL